jgi:hypothetical protein
MGGYEKMKILEYENKYSCILVFLYSRILVFSYSCILVFLYSRILVFSYSSE